MLRYVIVNDARFRDVPPMPVTSDSDLADYLAELRADGIPASRVTISWGHPKIGIMDEVEFYPTVVDRV
mgnify:CR=1 FL=1